MYAPVPGIEPRSSVFTGEFGPERQIICGRLTRVFVVYTRELKLTVDYLSAVFLLMVR